MWNVAHGAHTPTITLIHRPTIFCSIGFTVAACKLPLRRGKWKPRQIIAVSSASLTHSNTVHSVSLSNLGPSEEHRQLLPQISEEDFVVVNFYHFVFIEDPQAEVSKHLYFMRDLDIHGRIYLNEQGINAQYSGPSKHALAYANWLREDPRFLDILVQVSPAIDGHAFPKLKLRYKPSLVQLEGDFSHVSLLDPSKRAIPLTPSEWRKRLETLNGKRDTKYILLDIRNGYEWDIGHFQGAQRPTVDSFRYTSFGLSQTKDAASDPLANVDKEKTEVLMYCTGGIRCDVYSTILRERGFQNLYTLKGGVSNYLKDEGSKQWVGNLFVFDSRLSLPPSAYNPETESCSTPQFSGNNAFARCYICNSQVSQLRHRNCANLDCSLLFLCCKECVSELRGCCCSECTSSPRLRPVLAGPQRYQKWHIYRDFKQEQPT
ncbi:rhodanese-like domain-containing protein 8, chloroplastic isoform X1 [Cucumis melo]|uniref:Rhodanese-like domain-containing protein 8, chloroplastic isoform X1 n=1 Tax=Cucumis melo TaxID=3656 RepID=A0A1S3B7Y6_CUCME|nr:rhodanese-like domain-containing protein 8, chloroplastic isoform X1 [Cucumis melo]